MLNSSEPVQEDLGRDSDTLVIVTTGFFNQFGGMPIFEFRDVISQLGHNAILLTDQKALWYHAGVDEKRPDYPSLIAYLKGVIKRLKPKTVICTGTSAGGYASIVLGHELGADYVHAFGPQTTLLLPNLLRNPQGEFNKVDKGEEKYFDLAPLLEDDNGKTTYFLHYGVDYDLDKEFSLYLTGLPGVECIGYDFDKHNVSTYLGKAGFLKTLFSTEAQPRMKELIKARFTDAVFD